MSLLIVFSKCKIVSSVKIISNNLYSQKPGFKQKFVQGSLTFPNFPREGREGLEGWNWFK